MTGTGQFPEAGPGRDPGAATPEAPPGPRWGARLLQLALLAVVAWFIYRALAPDLAGITGRDLTRWRPAVLPLAGSFGLLLAMYVMHALLWRKVLRDLRLGRPTVRETLRIYFLASLGRYVPGKIWQLASMAVLAGRAGLPPVKATAAAVLGQLAYLATGLLFLAFSMPDWRGAVGASGSALPGALVFAAVAMAAGAILLWTLVATSAGHGARQWLLARAGGRARKLQSAFELGERIGAREATGWALGYGFSWVVLGAAFALFVGAFQADVLHQWRYLFGVVAASYLIGYAVPTPAGVGGREAVMVILLEPLLGPAGAVVVSVLSRVWFTAGELAPLLLLPVLRSGTPMQEAES